MSLARRSDDSSYHHGSLRDALLDRAAEVIEAEGLEALTLRGLARDLGVSHGAPNRHFPSREDLVAAVAVKGIESARAAMLASMAAADADPWVQLNAMGRGYLKWALGHRTLFRVVTHPDIGRLDHPDLDERMRETESMVRDAVRATQATGRHPDVDTDILTLYTQSVPWGAALLMTTPRAQLPEPGPELDDLIARIVELVVPITGRA